MTIKRILEESTYMSECCDASPIGQLIPITWQMLPNGHTISQHGECSNCNESSPFYEPVSPNSLLRQKLRQGPPIED